MNPYDAPHTKTGRGAGLAEDPLDRFAPDLGASLTRKLDLAADFLAPDFAGMTVAQLEAQRDFYRESLPPLDRERAANIRARDDIVATAEWNLRLAKEAVEIKEGLAAAVPPYARFVPNLVIDEAQKEVEKAEDAIHEAYDAAEALDDDFENSYHVDWALDNAETLASLISVERELQILEQGSAVARVTADEASLLAGRRFAESGWDRYIGGRRSTVVVKRNDVPHPPLLDPSYDALPEPRRQQLESLITPLAEWAARQSDRFIEARRAQFGPTAKAVFDLPAARLASRLDRLAKVHTQARDIALANAAREPEHVNVGQRAADAAQAKLDEIADTREYMRIEEEGGIEQRVYDRELEIREEMSREHAVLTAIEEPSHDVLVEAGPQPPRTSPEYSAWADRVRDIEDPRIVAASARAAGKVPPEPAEVAVEQTAAETGAGMDMSF